jgi:hypothetical protein
MNRSLEKVATALAAIYEEPFGGKGRGRYKISRRNLRRLSGRKRLEDTTIEKIVEAAYDQGFIMVDLGDDFAVVEEGVMLNYRPVPKVILSRYVSKVNSHNDLGREDDD